MRKTQEAYLAHAQRGAQAARGRRDDPGAERVARAGEPALKERSTAAMECAVGHRRRARLLHGRPLAARAAARARDRPRARPLAGRARRPRPRGALPRHRQARDPGRDPPQAGGLTGAGVGADARPRRGGRAHHRAPRLPGRRGACDQAPSRALRRRRLPGRAARRGDPARRADHPRRRRARLDAHEPRLSQRPPRRRGARRAAAWGGHAVLSALRAALHRALSVDTLLGDASALASASPRLLGRICGFAN